MADSDFGLQDFTFIKKMEMSIALVVFDLAGTTVKDDKDIHKVLRQTLAEHHVSISLEDANAVMGIPKPVAIRQLLEQRYTGNKAITEEWIDEIHTAFVTRMISFYKHDTSVGEKDGVSETFRKLKESKLKIVVDTGFDRQITDPLLERLGWLENNLIDGSVTSDEVERGRPYPDMIFRAMELTDVKDVQQVAKVGDTASDIQEGLSAGCKYVIGVTTGAFTHEQLKLERPTHLIERISELPAIVLH